MAEITKLPLHRSEKPDAERNGTVESGVIRTIDDFKAMFADAEARGDFGDAKIVSYRWSKTDHALHCVVRDGVTSSLLLYGMNTTNRKAHRLDAADH